MCKYHLNLVTPYKTINVFYENYLHSSRNAYYDK
jgi:hypothetical protein